MGYAGEPSVTSRRLALTTEGAFTPMAATETVAQSFLPRKSVDETSELKPRHGVITLSGFAR